MYDKAENYRPDGHPDGQLDDLDSGRNYGRKVGQDDRGDDLWQPLSTRRQILIVLAVALLNLAALGAVWATLHKRAPAEEYTTGGNQERMGDGSSNNNSGSERVDGSNGSNGSNGNTGNGVGGGHAAEAREFRLTGEQLQTLEIQPVTLRAFRSEESTEGHIALNGDAATQVFSPYSGRVLTVMVTSGEYVKKGTRLLRMEASEFSQAQGDLLNAAAALKLAQHGEERRHAAYDSQSGSLQDWQQAQTDLTVAQTAFASARNRLRIFGVSAAETTAMERGNAVEPETYVVAPIDGVVTDRQVGPGEYIQAGGQTPLFVIGDLSTVWLVADVRETDAPQIERGQAVEVEVAAFPKQIFKATLTSVGAQVDPVTHRVPVRATLSNPSGKLKPQMFAAFKIITSPVNEAPAVPEESVIREGAQSHVWVVKENNALTARAVHTGRSADGMIEVLDGLKAGEKVVTRGGLFMDRAAEPG